MTKVGRDREVTRQGKSGTKPMNTKINSLALCALLLALSVPVGAQQPAGKVPLIGFLTASSASDPVSALRLDLFRQGLRDLGYVEGKNINIEYRYAEGTI